MFCESSREVGGRKREVGGPGHLQCVLPQNWDGSEPNRTVPCMMLKARGNLLALCHDEIRRPQTGIADQARILVLMPSEISTGKRNDCAVTK
ncbi:hypothetical protein TNCV_5084761 [Trichonephila clavipes]|uniref:Uncharacterized protein n=1 Tax=Trichonephila clavipes TaxID=2585209 RepID=A0A8X6S5M7_TRICX|nr:hypothetical protein TNCV_5084761 [Trichonephila clavipes]